MKMVEQKKLTDEQREKLAGLEKEMNLAAADAEDAKSAFDSKVAAMRTALRRTLVALDEPADSVACLRCGAISIPQFSAQGQLKPCPCRAAKTE